MSSMSDVAAIDRRTSADDSHRSEPSLNTCADLSKCFHGTQALWERVHPRRLKHMHLVSNDARNADVLFPICNGKTFNYADRSTRHRWVINFGEWPLTAEASSYASESFDIVSRRRETASRQTDRGRLHEAVLLAVLRINDQSSLSTTSGMTTSARLLVVTKYIASASISCQLAIYSDQVAVFRVDGLGLSLCLQSSFHEDWVDCSTVTT